VTGVKGGCLSKPLLLWVDCTSGLPDAELRVRAAAYFEIEQVRGTSQAAAELARLKPHALCFDFDYPDQKCLQGMQAIKLSHPRLPILMLTFEHSESLAVWAFRARVELPGEARIIGGAGGESEGTRKSGHAPVAAPNGAAAARVRPE